MRVLYNFEMQSKSDRTYNPWLQDIFHLVTNMEKGDITLRVTKDKVNRKISYIAENKRNKTCAIFSKRRELINVIVMKKQLPDPSRYIKPEYVAISEVNAENNHLGKQTLAEIMIDVLCSDTPYSTQEYKRAKVYSTLGRAKAGESFTGGVVTDLQQVNDDAIVTTSTGLQFTLPFSAVMDKKVMLNKYIIMNDKRDFEVVQQNEFDQYFVLD